MHTLWHRLLACLHDHGGVHQKRSFFQIDHEHQNGNAYSAAYPRRAIAQFATARLLIVIFWGASWGFGRCMQLPTHLPYLKKKRKHFGLGMVWNVSTRSGSKLSYGFWATARKHMRTPLPSVRKPFHEAEIKALL